MDRTLIGSVYSSLAVGLWYTLGSELKFAKRRTRCECDGVLAEDGLGLGGIGMCVYMSPDDSFAASSLSIFSALCNNSSNSVFVNT